MTVRPSSKPAAAPDGTVAGILLVACGILSVAVVSHHPVAHGHSHGAVLRQIAALSTMDELVHGTLIVFMLALAYAACVFALRRGLRDQTALAGLVCYLIGIAAVLGAALTDGFFVPMLGPSMELLQGASIAIQVLTKFAVAAMSLGIFLWACGLAFERGMPRIAAIAGAVASLASLGVLAFGVHSLEPHSVTLLMTLQAVWYVCLGALLIRREL